MHLVLTYDREHVQEGTVDDLKRRSCTWLHAWEPTPEELTLVAAHIGMDPDALRELLSPSQRPALQDTATFSVIVVRSPRKNAEFLTKPIVLAVSKAKNDLISITPYHSGSIERITASPEQRKTTMFAGGATALLHVILDEVTTSYFNVFDRIDSEMERIERGIRNHRTDAKIMETIYGLKKTLIYFHKALVGNREVITAIEQSYAQFLDAALLSKFRHLHDRTVQLVELGATYRDILTSTLEVHLSVVSNALNVTVKKVTSWGAIILIPSLIASIFGMNFDIIPAAHVRYGFWGALGVMAIATIALHGYFRKKDWM